MSQSSPLLDFNEHNSASVVASRFRAAKSAPARALLILIDHLHAAVREARPSREDWHEAIAFLTEVGHASDERRQEWVLLSDVLGISALVEELNSGRPPAATRNTARKPFYRADAPELRSGASISLDAEGEPLRVSVRVADLEGRPIAGASVETWQANAEGWYENQQPDLQPEWNLRGRFRTDARGCVSYVTVKPAGYDLPADGPVGRLFGRLGVPLRRPAPLHFLIRADGHDTLSTEIFDGNDPHLGEDALFGARRSLLGDFRPLAPAQGAGWTTDLTFVLARSKGEGTP